MVFEKVLAIDMRETLAKMNKHVYLNFSIKTYVR